jgi:SpoVK/Ycf46/Vps4 family AAA+-type ATPase
VDQIKQEIWKFIEAQDVQIKNDSIFYISKDFLSCLEDSVTSVTFYDEINQNATESSINYVFYEFYNQASEIETIENQDESIASSNHHILPSKEFQGLWESLIYENNIKENLLDFVQTTMLFSAKKVDYNIINCNRLVLLHGPAGTGKTSLAKALAQKLSIHMKKFLFTHLFEINSHSLFSKWFSESGKLVMKMFQQIQEVIEMESSLVIVLIDEVESIAYSRSSISDNEPTDSLRVVNAVLTQLDRIKRYSNVLIVTTSNLTSSIDLAFLDRADIVQFIGQPSQNAIYQIFLGAIKELVKAEIIKNPQEIDFKSLEKHQGESAAELMRLSQHCKRFSGRTLRKLPFLAHALFLKKDEVTLEEFLVGLRLAIQKHLKDKVKISENGDSEVNTINGHGLL